MMLYSAWLRLPIATRHKIASIFKIPKTGATEVVSNDVVKDGYNINDIESALTKEALQNYLGTTIDNYDYLWEDTVATVEGNAVKQRDVPVESAPFTAAIEEEPITTIEEPETVKTEIEDSNTSSEIATNTNEELAEIKQEQEKPKNKGGRPRKHDQEN